MSSYTPVFRLPYLYSKETITEPMERVRYLTIDKQLESLFTFLGDGIISGWTIAANETNTSVVLSAGSGILLNMAVATTIESDLGNANLAESGIIGFTYSTTEDTVNYIYIESIYTTPMTAAGRVVLTTSQQDTSTYLYLGKVIFDTNGKVKEIPALDATDRKELAILRYLLESLSKHLHTGAPGQPDKIDLSNHVKGILSSANIQDLSASKVTSGTFSKERLNISHRDLNDIGTLTHPDLDSLVDKFQNVNKTLFGDLMTSNLIQLLLSLKHVYADSDDYMTNMFTVIPGVANCTENNDESFIDQNSTSAEIDYTNHRIRGKYIASEEIGSIKMQTLAELSYDGNNEKTYDERYVLATPSLKDIVSSTGTTVVTLAVNDHRYNNGDRVIVEGHSVVAVNGTWFVENVSENTFDLKGSTWTINGGATGTTRPYDDIIDFTIVPSSSSTVMFDVSAGQAYTVPTDGRIMNWTDVVPGTVQVLNEKKFLICSANRNRTFRNAGVSNLLTFTVDEEVEAGVREIAVNSGSLALMFNTKIDMSTDSTVQFNLTQVAYQRNKKTRSVESYSRFTNYASDFDAQWSPDLSLDLYVEFTVGTNRYFYKYLTSPFLDVRNNSLFSAGLDQAATATKPAKTKVSAGISLSNLTWVCGHVIPGGLSAETAMTTTSIDTAASNGWIAPQGTDVSYLFSNVTGLYLYSANDTHLFNVDLEDTKGLDATASYDIYFPMGRRNELSLLDIDDNPEDMQEFYTDIIPSNKTYRQSTMLVDIEKVTLGDISFYRKDIDKNKIEDITIDFGSASVDFTSISFNTSTNLLVNDSVVYFQVKRIATNNGEDPDIDYGTERIYTNNIAGLTDLIANEDEFSFMSDSTILGSGGSFPVQFNHITKLGIRVVLVPNYNQTSTPIFNSVTVGYVSNTVAGDVTVETSTQWNNYRAKKNVVINTVGNTYATMLLTSTTTSSAVGKINNVIYGTNKYVVEKSASVWGTTLKMYSGVNNLPLTVSQMIMGTSAGLSGYVTGLKKLKNGNIVILDQDSSRIIELDQNYNLLKIIASEYAYKNNLPTGFTTLTPSLKKVIYNEFLGNYGVLYLVFSHETTSWAASEETDNIDSFDLTKFVITNKGTSYDLSECTAFPCDRGIVCVVLNSEIGELINNTASLKLIAKYKSNAEDTEDACLTFTATVVPYGIENVAIEKISYNLIYAPIQGIVAFDTDDDDVWYILKQATPYSTYDTRVEPWYVAIDSTVYWQGWLETTGLYRGGTTAIIPVSNFRKFADTKWVPDFELNNFYGYRGTIQKKDDYLLIVVSGETNEILTSNHDGVLIFKKSATGKYLGPTQIDVGEYVYPMAARFDCDSYDSVNKIYGKIYMALSSLTSFSSVSANSLSRVVLYNDSTGVEESVWGLIEGEEYILNVNDVFPLEFPFHILPDDMDSALLVNPIVVST